MRLSITYRTNLEGAKQVVVDMFTFNSGLSLVGYLCFNDEMRTVHAGSEDIGLRAAGRPNQRHYYPPSSNRAMEVSNRSSYWSAERGPAKLHGPESIPSLPVYALHHIDKAGPRRASSPHRQAEPEEVASYSLVSSEKRAPQTDMEARLREVWAAILKVPVESIGRDDSFLRIGGDSITAIQVVGRAQEAGTALTVKDIFDDPRLAAVAAKASDMEGGLGSHPGITSGTI